MLKRSLFILALLLWSATSAMAAPTMDDVRDAYLKKDYERAVSLLTPMVAAGDDNAMMALGRMNEAGKGTPKSFKKAVELYKRAVTEKGSTEGMTTIAMMSASGIGMEKNQALAMKLLDRASRLGDGTAAYNYGMMMIGGATKYSQTSTPKDFYDAYKWFRIAAKGDPKRSIYRGVSDNTADMLVLGGKLSKADAAKADKEVAVWKPLKDASTLGPLPAIPAGVETLPPIIKAAPAAEVKKP